MKDSDYIAAWEIAYMDIAAHALRQAMVYDNWPGLASALEHINRTRHKAETNWNFHLENRDSDGKHEG